MNVNIWKMFSFLWICCIHLTGIALWYPSEALVIRFYFTNKHCVKSVRVRSYSGPHFFAFGLNTERYSVSLRFQSECGKIRTRKTPSTDTFHAVKIFSNHSKSIQRKGGKAYTEIMNFDMEDRTRRKSILSEYLNFSGLQWNTMKRLLKIRWLFLEKCCNKEM